MLAGILYEKNIGSKGPFWWCAGQLLHVTFLKGEKGEGEKREEYTYEV